MDKIEIIEKSFNEKKYVIEDKVITYFYNDELIDKKMINNFDEYVYLVRNASMLWKNEYIDNKIIDGKRVEINIYIDKEKTTYLFVNKYPINYLSFINTLEEMMGL